MSVKASVVLEVVYVYINVCREVLLLCFGIGEVKLCNIEFVKTILRGPCILHSHQHLLFLDFCMTAILTGMRL